MQIGVLDAVSGRGRRSCARRNLFVHLFALVIATSSMGCAPLTEQEQFERDNRLNLAKEDFLVREENCRRSGGAMQMRATPLSKYGTHDYKTARCVAH